MSGRRTWVTLVTRSSYTPGVLALKASLDAIGTAYPLLVLVTSALPAEDREILSALGCALHDIEHIPNSSVVASWSSHWDDVYCKLAAFGLEDYERMGFIDADAVVIRAIDHVFDIEVPASQILATQNCYEDKHDSLCRFKLLLNDDPITTPVLEPPFNDGLNSGMFVARPSVGLFKRILNHVRTDIVIRHNVDGDQGVINHVFRNSIKWLPYLYNAQTHAVHHHPSFLKAALDHGCVIHYTARKPWMLPADEDSQNNHRVVEQLERLFWPFYDVAIAKLDDAQARYVRVSVNEGQRIS